MTIRDEHQMLLDNPLVASCLSLLKASDAAHERFIQSQIEHDRRVVAMLDSVPALSLPVVEDVP